MLEIYRERLAGGAVLLASKRPTGGVYALGSFPLGAYVEPEDREGLLALLADMLLKGTKEKSEEEIMAEIEGLGSTACFSAGYDCFMFTIRTTRDAFSEVVRKVFDYALNAAFEEDEVRRAKEKALTDLKELEQDPSFVAMREFRRTLFPREHHYSKVLAGTEKGIASITRDDLLSVFERLSTRGAIVAVVGEVEPEEAAATFEEALEGLSRSEPPRPSPPELTRPSENITREIRLPGKTQAVVLLGSLAMPRRHPDYHKLLLANDVLGVFGLMGRLGRRIRAKAGLAYFVYSAIKAELYGGYWVVHGGFNPARVDEAVSMVIEELERISKEGVMEEELRNSKGHLLGSFDVMLESPAYLASLLHFIEFYSLGLDYPERFKSEIAEMTVDDVKEVAEKYLRPEGYVKVVVRP